MFFNWELVYGYGYMVSVLIIKRIGFDIWKGNDFFFWWLI